MYKHKERGINIADARIELDLQMLQNSLFQPLT